MCQQKGGTDKRQNEGQGMLGSDTALMVAWKDSLCSSEETGI